MIMMMITSVLLGVAIGIVYDLFRILRELYPFKKASTMWLDLFFFFLATIMTLLFSVAVGGGQLRVYVLAMGILGVWLYQQSLSRLVVFLGVLVGRQLKRFVWFLYALLVRPCRRFMRWVIPKIAPLPLKLSSTFWWKSHRKKTPSAPTVQANR